VNVPYLDISAQTRLIRPALEQAIGDVLDSGSFVLGPHVTAFENEFGSALGGIGTVACNSGTSALHLILKALGIGPGDEVVTVSMTFAATVAAVLYTGATPVVVDIEPHSWTMDPDQLRRAISAKTKAVIPVHLHGRLADMASICDIADAAGVPVIEDAAQAHLAHRGDQYVGCFGLAAAFSFYPGKNLGALGEGGAVVSRDAQLLKDVARLRDWGTDYKYDHQTLGFNYRMDGIQGAVLSVKLGLLSEWTHERVRKAIVYEGLRSNPGLSLPTLDTTGGHSYHVYSILVREPERLGQELARVGIATGRHYPVPVHLQRAYHASVQPLGDLSRTVEFARSCLSLPLYPELSDPQQEYVIEQLDRLLGAR